VLCCKTFITIVNVNALELDIVLVLFLFVNIIDMLKTNSTLQYKSLQYQKQYLLLTNLIHVKQIIIGRLL